MEREQWNAAVERKRQEKKSRIDPRIVLKGAHKGNCNVTDCQRPGAEYWNTSTCAYYCSECAGKINYWSKRDEGFNICFHDPEGAGASKFSFGEG